MLKLNDKQQRPPYGGHQYFEYGIMFKGDSFADVVQKLKDFRLNNNIAVGDPEQEVLRHYATHWPWTVKKDRTPHEEEITNLNYVDWRNWVFAVWRKPPTKAITVKEASDRWSTCLTCPFNVAKDWDETDESKEVDKRVFVLRRGLDVPSGLGYCTHHKCDLGVFTFIDKVANYAARYKELPANCWAKE